MPAAGVFPGGCGSLTRDRRLSAPQTQTEVTIKLREIGIEQDLLMAKDVDQQHDLFRNELRCAFPGRGFLFGSQGGN